MTEIPDYAAILKTKKADPMPTFHEDLTAHISEAFGETDRWRLTVTLPKSGDSYRDQVTVTTSSTDIGFTVDGKPTPAQLERLSFLQGGAEAPKPSYGGRVKRAWRNDAPTVFLTGFLLLLLLFIFVGCVIWMVAS